jgi:hypothetical protein
MGNVDRPAKARIWPCSHRAGLIASPYTITRCDVREVSIIADEAMWLRKAILGNSYNLRFAKPRSEITSAVWH